MGRLKLEVLSGVEIEKIHQRSLDILEKTGIVVHDDECRQVLAKAGAKVDTGSDRVYLPGKMVNEYLALAPSNFEIHRIDGKKIQVDEQCRAYGSLVTDPWIIDYATQKPRKPVLNDIVRHTRLGDALPVVDFLYRMDMPPADVPPETAYIKTLEVFTTNTTKHILAAPASIESMHNWLEVTEILADDKTLSEKPLVTFSVPITTPLVFDKMNAYLFKTVIKKGLPLSAQSEPIAGTTAPLSFAGGLLMANCENIFLVVMAQMLKAGTPIFYSAGNCMTDMATGRVLFYNADKMLWKISISQMADFYNLPLEGETAGTMVGRYDVQCGIEYALTMLPTLACGRGFFNGLGSCYNACGMSAEMIMIQADLIQLLERISAGINTNDEMSGVDSITSVGPGGTFLTDPLTIKMLRSGEFFTDGCFDRLGEQSPNDPKDSMLVRTHEKVEQLLSTHKPAVPEKTVDEIHRWARKKEESLS